MVNPAKVHAMLRNLETTVAILQQIAKTPRSQFLGDYQALGSAKYYLQTAIETCINIGNHIIASEHYRAPQDYREVFTVLSENQLIPMDFTVRLRKMAGLRNRLVHLYWDVDDELIYRFLQEDLGDFDLFSHYTLAFLTGR